MRVAGMATRTLDNNIWVMEPEVRLSLPARVLNALGLQLALGHAGAHVAGVDQRPVQREAALSKCAPTYVQHMVQAGLHMGWTKRTAGAARYGHAKRVVLF